MKSVLTFFAVILTAVIITSVFNQCGTKKAARAQADESGEENTWNTDIRKNADDMMEKGRAVFRFETFGNEAFWTDQLQLHKAIADQGAGGIGPGLTPKAALDAGLKVDIDVLPKFVKQQVAEGKLLNDVDFTLTLL